jgi:phosphohistidine phosphatase
VKRLWLLRHAKAVSAETAPADFTRQLAERGERDARWISERLASGPHRPARIVASPAARTRRTAEIVAEVLARPSSSLVFDERLYLAAAGTLAAAVMATANDVESLLVVGHNPGLSELALDLVPELPLDDLPTSGIVGIDVDAASWSELETARKRLRCYDFPKNAGPPITLR